VLSGQQDLWLNSCSLAADASDLIDRLLNSTSVDELSKFALLANAFALETIVDPGEATADSVTQLHVN
jgi:hypothetical protein